MVIKFASSAFSSHGTLRVHKFITDAQGPTPGCETPRRSSAKYGRLSSYSQLPPVSPRSAISHDATNLVESRLLSLLLDDDITAREIAETLTMVRRLSLQLSKAAQTEFALFKKLQPCEFIGGAWQKRDKNQKAPMLVAITERFNRVSNWITSEVVLAPDSTARSKVLEKALKIMSVCSRRQPPTLTFRLQICLELHSFNSAIEILSGLRSCAAERAFKVARWVRREPHTQQSVAIPSKLRQQLEEASDIVDPVGNWKNLNERTAAVSAPGKKRDVPVLPFLAPNLTTLVQLSEVL